MSATEDGISDLMADYLRSSGISAVTQVSISTPGTRSQPDFQITNGGTFVGEAKWESKKWEGFGEARDYGQLTGVEGSFLIVYPEALRDEGGQARLQDTPESVLSGHTYSCAFLRRDEPTDIVRLELENIPSWLESNIQRRRRPEPDPDEVVSVLRQTAHTLNEELQAAPEENLFRNVLGATPDEEEEREAARQTAGFLLVNQLTFYRVLASTDRFPEIDPDMLSSPRDLGEYFDLVLEVDYTPVFSFRISEDLPDESLTILKDAIKTINSLSPESVDHDVLGTVFHELIPLEARKQVAAYYTMSKPAEILAELSIDGADARVMDPACGSGTMLVSAYQRKKTLSGTWTEETHRQFVENDITGIDVMPFAAHLSCIHLALQAPIFETDDVNIGIEDSTKTSPGETISPLSFVLPEREQQRSIQEWDAGESPDVSGETVEAGSVTVDAAAGREMDLDTVDVVMMNPPFTRQESVAGFAEGYKDRLRGRFSDRDRRGHVHGKMSYCSYFMFLADKFLDEGGRIAAVLPATVLAKSSDEGVRDMLVNEYNIEYILAREDNPNFSEDTDLREVIVIARKCEPDPDGSVTCVAFDGLDVAASDIQSAAASLDVEDTIETRTVHGENGSEAAVWRIPYEDLDVHSLFLPFAASDRDLIRSWYELVEGSNELVQVQDLNPGLTRGGSSHPWTRGVLADPETQLRSTDLWVVERDEDPLTIRHRHVNEEVEVPKTAVEPYFLRKPHRERVDVSGISEYTIVREFEDLPRFLELAEQDSIPGSWESHVTENAAFTAIPETVDLTASGTCHVVYYSNRPRLWHRMWMHSDIDDLTVSKVLALWFDSTFGALQFLLTRIPARGGWTKYRKYSQERFLTLDTGELSNDDVETLVDAFDDVSGADAPNLVTQLAMNASRDRISEDDLETVDEYFDGVAGRIGEVYEPRRRMDFVVASVLGVSDAELDSFVEGLCSDLLVELATLKEMMD